METHKPEHNASMPLLLCYQTRLLEMYKMHQLELLKVLRLGIVRIRIAS